MRFNFDDSSMRFDSVVAVPLTHQKSDLNLDIAVESVIQDGWPVRDLLLSESTWPHIHQAHLPRKIFYPVLLTSFHLTLKILANRRNEGSTQADFEWYLDERP